MRPDDAARLFDQLFPAFFRSESIRSLPPDGAWEELCLRLDAWDADAYAIPLPEGVTFGFYRGDPEVLRAAVAEVDEDWVQYFGDTRRVYCGYWQGRIASFCQAEPFAAACLDGVPLRVAGPGCVGTVPAMRRRGIGLAMVRNVTRLLKAEGYDLSWIHYTGVAPWYRKLGYQTVLTWTRDGIRSAGG